MIDTFVQNISINKKNKKQPIHEQIRMQFKKIIVDECFEGEHLPAVTALAERLGVNYRTMKSALDLLEKDRIIKFQRNGVAVVNSIVERKTAKEVTLSFIRWCPDAFWIGIYEGINRYVAEHNLQCILIDSAGSATKYLSAIEDPGVEIDGMILAPIFEKPELVSAVKSLIDRGVKVVFADCILPDLDLSSVTCDNFLGAYSATKHLLSLHYIPVYYVGGIRALSSARERGKGWGQAMREFNFSELEKFSLDVKDECNSYEIIDFVKRFFEDHKEGKYSILTANDYIARDIYAAAEQTGLVIGKDVFIAGFGDFPFAKTLSVPLTSIDQNPERTGYVAAKVLYETINEQIKRPVSRLIPVQMIIRESSVGTGK